MNSPAPVFTTRTCDACQFMFIGLTFCYDLGRFCHDCHEKMHDKKD